MFSDLCVFTQKGKWPPRYILFYKFLVTYPDFMKFGDFSSNLSGTNILEIFSKFELVFPVSGVVFCV